MYQYTLTMVYKAQTSVFASLVILCSHFIFWKAKLLHYALKTPVIVFSVLSVLISYAGHNFKRVIK